VPHEPQDAGDRLAAALRRLLRRGAEEMVRHRQGRHGEDRRQIATEKVQVEDKLRDKLKGKLGDFLNRD
jgi:hypothetical protein